LDSERSSRRRCRTLDLLAGWHQRGAVLQRPAIVLHVRDLDPARGKVLPCHAAESITGLEFWNVRDHSLADIWTHSPAFNAFRGSAWMKEPCASCPRRELDFGGCRCQAFALTGNPTATDPVCHLAPDHAQVAELAAVRTDAPYVYRRMRARSSGVDNGTNRYGPSAGTGT
jgi:radical SAM protein with 4Fe4S-binding SPASM domain